jgi:hypothetical protein
MIRRVAFKKAFLGGVIRVLAWEVTIRVRILLGLPMFDIVLILGTLLCRGGALFWQWWGAPALSRADLKPPLLARRS